MEPLLTNTKSFSLRPGIYQGRWIDYNIKIDSVYGSYSLSTVNRCYDEKRCTIHISSSRNIFVKCDETPQPSSPKPTFGLSDTMIVRHGGWDEEDDRDGFLIKAADKRKKITEALTIAQRMKRRMVMRRSRNKILVARKRAAKRKATPDVLKKRALRGARTLLTKKFLKKKPSEATYGERIRVEKILKTKGALINRIAKRLLPVLRKKEAARYKKQVSGEDN